MGSSLRKDSGSLLALFFKPVLCPLSECRMDENKTRRINFGVFRANFNCAIEVDVQDHVMKSVVGKTHPMYLRLQKWGPSLRPGTCDPALYFSGAPADVKRSPHRNRTQIGIT